MPSTPGSGNFDTNAMYVTGTITTAEVKGHTTVLTGTATVTGIGAGANRLLHLLVQIVSDLCGGQRPDVCPLVHRIADNQLARLLDEELAKLLEYLLVHHETLRGDARLTVVDHPRCHGSLCGVIQVSTRHHDERVASP